MDGLRYSIPTNYVMEMGLREIEKRKQRYDCTKTDRQLRIGGRVLCRIPGLASKLEDSWVNEKLGDMNYRFDSDGKDPRCFM